MYVEAGPFRLAASRVIHARTVFRFAGYHCFAERAGTPSGNDSKLTAGATSPPFALKVLPALFAAARG
jgi:hypothetical protein